MISRLHKFLLIVGLLFGGLSSIAQDIHFTQFYATPLTQNAANTGDFTGDWRASFIHRRQWWNDLTPFKTTGIGIDKPFILLGQRISAGLHVVSDKSGSNLVLSTTKIMLSVAYQKEISGHIFNIGVQPGYVMKAPNGENTTMSQYDHSIGGYNESLSTGETALTEKVNFVDFNTGINWRKRYGKATPSAGFALYHLIQPKESFIENKDNKLGMGNNLNLGLRYELNDKFYVFPKINNQLNRGANEFMFNVNVGRYLPKNKQDISEIYAGLLSQTGFNTAISSPYYDVTSVIVGLKVKNFDIGVAFDLTHTRSLKNQNAIEISVIYIAPSTLLEKITIPCERL